LNPESVHVLARCRKGKKGRREKMRKVEWSGSRRREK
jgi:hypothetical protein